MTQFRYIDIYVRFQTLWALVDISPNSKNKLRSHFTSDGGFIVTIHHVSTCFFVLKEKKIDNKSYPPLEKNEKISIFINK